MALLHIIEDGDVEGAFKKLGSLIKGVFVNDVEPVLLAFINQFDSDFGKAALAAAASAAGQVASGQASIVQAGTQLAETLLKQGLDTAGHDAGQVALNAIGVALRAPGGK